MNGEKPLWRRAVLNLDVIVACVMLAVLIFVTFFAVLMRYIVGSPIGWAEEVQLACMVWIVFAAGGAAFRFGNHVAIEMLVDTFPQKIQRAVEVLIGGVLVVVLLYLTWQSIGFIAMQLRSGRSTSFLQIPYAHIYAIAPVSFILMIVSYFYSLRIGARSEAGEAIKGE